MSHTHCMYRHVSHCIVNHSHSIVAFNSDCREKDVAPAATDDKAAKRLWAISEHWTHVVAEASENM